MPTKTPRRAHLLALADRLLQTRTVHGRCYHWADETTTWWRVTVAQRLDLGRRIDRGDPNPYSEWCASHAATEMPRDWRPSR